MNIISTDTEAQSKNFNGVYHIKGEQICKADCLLHYMMKNL